MSYPQKKPVPVIDVFAGPGGLGEGFSALGRHESGQYFKIGLSVEKDCSAHSTLELRSFFRQFPFDNVPEDYYAFLRCEITRDELYRRHPEEASAAKDEAWHAALGSGEEFDEELDRKISRIIAGHERWVLIGGPPCQAYSVIGRSRNTGVKDYRPEDDERHYLYIEYLRIIARHRPAVFVMENVKGILSSRVQGRRIFDSILADLKSPSSVFSRYSDTYPSQYKIFSLVMRPEGNGSLAPEDFIVECEKYGIPQARHRVILLGIREDICGVTPAILAPEHEVRVEDVLAELPGLRSGLSREADSASTWKRRIAQALDRKWLRVVKKQWGADLYGQLVEVLGNLEAPVYDRGAEYIPCKTHVRGDLTWWYHDPRLKGICNHVSRGHMHKDIHRYLFASCFARQFNRSPKLHDYPPDLLPEHKNAKSGDFDDRFRVQLYGRPSTTITSHISKDGHYFIHPDPYQCRSLTVREAARLQTFPDNYFFSGNRTQQYTQVGNAVPPLLAYKVASIVKDFLDAVR